MPDTLEIPLTIIFGALATTLALISIGVAYLQYRLYARQAEPAQTPSRIESGHGRHVFTAVALVPFRKTMKPSRSVLQ